MGSFVSPSNGSAKSSPGSTMRVMIVDNHEIFRHGLRDILNGIRGYHVVAEARCSSDAIAHIGRMPIDLVLLNLYLPDTDGVETTQLLRKFDPPPYVIILSTTIDDDALLDTVLAGASGYLTVDMPAVEMIRALQDFQQGRLAMLPDVATRIVRLLVQKCHDLARHIEGLEAELNADLQDGPKIVNLAASPLSNTVTTTSGTYLQILTPQEEKVFQLLRQGKSNKQIAAQLAISHYTVSKHVQNILRKFGATNRTQAVSYTSFEGDGHVYR